MTIYSPTVPLIKEEIAPRHWQEILLFLSSHPRTCSALWKYHKKVRSWFTRMEGRKPSWKIEWTYAGTQPRPSMKRKITRSVARETRCIVSRTTTGYGHWHPGSRNSPSSALPIRYVAESFNPPENLLGWKQRWIEEPYIGRSRVLMLSSPLQMWKTF